MNKIASGRAESRKPKAAGGVCSDALSFLSRSAMAFLELPPEGDLFSLIADLLAELLDSDAIIAVSDYDLEAGLFRPKAIRGLGNMGEAIRKILGQNPMELAGDFGPAARKALTTGKFAKVESGLSDFTNNLLPAPVAKAIEKLLGLTEFYVVGFARAGRIEGGLSIVTRRQKALPAAALLEAFAAQAAVALERRRTQEFTRETESTLRAFINALPGPALLLGPEGLILEVNEPMVRSLRKSRPEIIGQIAFSLLPHEIARRRREHFETVLKTGRPEIFEDSRAGVLYLNSIYPVGDEKNGVSRVAVFAVDISERKRAEEALRKSEERLREAQALGKIGCWEFDLATRAIEWSDEVYALYERDRTLGPPSEEEEASYYSPDQVRMLRDYARRAAEKGEEFRYDLEARLPGGKTVFFHASMRPVKDEAGRVVKLFGTVQDVSERKKAENDLRESEEKYRRLVQNSLMGIGLSQGNRVIFANPALLNIFGYADLEEFARIPLLDHVAPASREAIIERMRRAAAGEYSRADFEYNILRKNGAERTLHAGSTHLVIGGEVFTQTVFQDITEQKKTEERLLQSAALLRRTLKEAINALASAIEMRDPYTAGHQEKVTRLSVAIAGEMDLSEESIEALQIAGTVHDIGKLGIPAEILNKPDKLADIEFALIKTHVEIGYRILNKIEFPWPIAQIVYQHHERMNGSGYPRGLTGDDLLIEAKILSVADTVEAMSSHRPYRPALGVEAALREISEKRGVLYSSDAVEACLKLFAENRFRF